MREWRTHSKEALAAYITREQLRQWLAEKQPDTYLGDTRSARNCPIQQFFQQRYPDSTWAVGVITVEEHTENLLHEYLVPLWLETLIRRIDRTGGEGSIPVVAQTVLELLEKPE